MIKDEANILLEIHLQELGLTFVREFAFALPRKWRFDYLLCSKGSKAAIEIEGAVWTQGRHTRGAGYLGDMEKYREAAALGYKVYRFSTEEVLKGVARTFIEKHCKGEEAQMTEQLLYERALEYWMKRAKTAEAIIAAHCPRQEAPPMTARQWMQQTGEHATELRSLVGEEIFNQILCDMDEFAETVSVSGVAAQAGLSEKEKQVGRESE